MASHVKLDQPGLTAAMDRVVKAKEQYDDAMAVIKSVIDDLETVWKGDSQVSMHNRYYSNKKTFDAFSVEIGEYIDGMKKTLNDLPGSDLDTAASIRKLGRL